MSNIKAILFDMDGTLVDSEPLHFEAHKRALENFGFSITKEDYMENGVSGGKRPFYEVMSEKYGKDVDMEEARIMKKDFYKELIGKINIFDGVKDVVEKLSTKYRLAIVSTSHMENIHRTLEHVGIEDFFEAFSSAKDMPKGKPAPDVYLDSLKKLGLNPEECVAIEDSQNGVEAAKNAGVKCIAIPCEYTKNQDFSRADLVLEKITDVNEDIINSL